jgi:formyltetrahydrofolate deformylase
MAAALARLRLSCPDRPGIIAAVTGFLHQQGANITDLDQHSTDPEGGTLFMRLEFLTSHLSVDEAELEKKFGGDLAPRFNMQWQLSFSARRKKIVILVSKQEHALLELLWRHNRQQIEGDIVAVISNHPERRREVAGFNIPYHEVPVNAQAKDESEKRILELAGDADLLVLARYMQVLSGDFVRRFTHRIINIHHSFLPSFAGAEPYRQAYERGVKLIGATAHYVTEELDAGPIIEQDVMRVSHHHSVAELRELGRDIERNVLARAVKWHLEDRILVWGNKTIVFGR